VDAPAHTLKTTRRATAAVGYLYSSALDGSVMVDGWDYPAGAGHAASRAPRDITRVRGRYRGSAYRPDAGLVTVVIPCYNQARFLGEAIESALSQTYKNFEVVVVDDGSDDHTSEVAARYGRVRLVRQENKGLSAARNRGFAEGRGEYVVFLDADDRLLPDALEVGVGKLETHPNCAFVSGHCTLIAVDGSALQTPHQFHIRKAHYRALLRGNYIWNPASVIYRSTVLNSIGGFDPSVSPSADYDLYLRIARDYPVHCHEHVVVEARRHGANMSSDYERMLKYSLIVLESQWRYARGNECDEEAYRQGINHYRKYYGGLARRQRLVSKVLGTVRATLPRDATVVVVSELGEGLFELDSRQGWLFPQIGNGASERLFAQGTRGSKEAPWIETGKSYEFRLYSGTDSTERLATVTVARSTDAVPSTAVHKSANSGRKPFLVASPNPVPDGDGPGRTDVSWWTGDGSEGQVYVSECRGIADEQEAIAHLETLRTRGGEFLLIPAASYWWLGRYARLRRHLQNQYPIAFEGEDTCLIFDLRDKKAADR
jgi:glycosyltransferase involved in cell wall biosynthesis